MGNVGRFFCVALPIALTAASLIALLVGGLAGIGNTGLYMFDVDLKNMSISPAEITSLVDKVTNKRHVADLFESATANVDASSAPALTNNITYPDLSLAERYQINVWNYCYKDAEGKTQCTKAKFNWAQDSLNKSTSNVEALMTLSGQKVQLPKEIKDAVSLFTNMIKWTEVVFIIAYVALGVELLMGVFANCSRAISCCTWVFAGFATVAVIAAAGMATGVSLVVVGAVKASAKVYGVQAALNSRFLAAVWIAAAFALAAGLFWMFTICCCKPDHSSRKSRGVRHRDAADDGEKLMGGGANGQYHPLNDQHNNGFYNRQSAYAPQARYPSGGRTDLAYEPYSHSRY
ncbi:uncharacterized protein E0L32_011973 [Thyridium curvatum]|uniref:SUR7 protein n=1 Tax=Thyridium curvatum TaxID=1093900 RepID=A0A507B6Q4_9PEZI|nr:uncharacterized protein E0L32_011973 [Thyridium curvatum]TPX17972.1 hypothetical protein E0L32_011973 [Thyridium curvatum]